MDQLYNVQVKPITVPPKTPNEPQGRDTFLTPRYAVDILLPYIPKNITNIWECAAGDGRISKVLKDKGYGVKSTDIREFPETEIYNFITDQKKIFKNNNFVIITNPPFSIKELFIKKAMDYDVPFAFLINADYSGTQIGWIEKYKCEKIIPERRINFLTPNIVDRINDGEFLKIINASEKTKYKKIEDIDNSLIIKYNEKKSSYTNINEIPTNLLAKYSSAQFHSMWLTRGFNLGKTETFVKLTNKQIKEDIL